MSTSKVINLKKILIATVLAIALTLITPAAAFAAPEDTESTGSTELAQDPGSDISLTFLSAPSEISIGGVASISYELTGAAAGIEIEWASSNADVATVDEKGNVTGVSPGSVEISASIGGTRYQSALINVIPAKVESVSIWVYEWRDMDGQGNSADINEGDELHLQIITTPQDAPIGAVTWSTSDAKVVSIDDSGVIKAVSGGTAVINAQLGDLNAEYTFTVIPAKGEEAVAGGGEAAAGGEAGPTTLLLIGILIAVVAVAAIITVLVIVRNRKIKEEEESEKAAAEKRRKAQQQQDAAEYAKSYADISSQNTERLTVIYGQMQASSPFDPFPEQKKEDGSPDRPFSLEDLEEDLRS